MLLILSMLVQIGLIVHCVRTGRNTIWIFVLLFGSLLGAIVYLLVEVLPELTGSRATRRAVRGMRSALDPGHELRRLQDQARISGGIDAQQRYAEELLRQGKSAEAIEVYRKTLSGLYEYDPNLMLGLARAQFANQQVSEARATLDLLIQRNPDFRSPDGHLLYARALEAEGNSDKALDEYATLSQYFAGAEARVRYGQLLVKCGRKDQARQVLKELLETARVSPKHYRRAQAEWLALAEKELAGL